MLMPQSTGSRPTADTHGLEARAPVLERSTGFQPVSIFNSPCMEKEHAVEVLFRKPSAQTAGAENFPGWSECLPLIFRDGNMAWMALPRVVVSVLFSLLFCQCAFHPPQAGAKLKPLPVSERERLDRVAPRLAKALPNIRHGRKIPWTFTVIPASGRNARSRPDGRVEVTRGLLSFVRTDGELAAVLAHEMSHVTLGHGRARAAAAWGVLLGGAALAVLANNNDIAGGWASAGIGTGAVFTISLTGVTAFHRAQEFEADAASIAVLRRAGYPDGSAADFWEHYESGRAAEGRSGGGWWSSHPPDAERIRRLREAAAAK